MPTMTKPRLFVMDLYGHYNRCLLVWGIVFFLVTFES